MFDLLKKKISGFVDKLGGKEKEPAPEKKAGEKARATEGKPGKKAGPIKEKEVLPAGPMEVEEIWPEEKKREVPKKRMEPLEAKKETPKEERAPEKRIEEKPKKEAVGAEKRGPKPEEAPEEKKKVEEKAPEKGKVGEKAPEKKKGGLFERILGPKKEKKKVPEERPEEEPIEIEKEPPVKKEEEITHPEVPGKEREKPLEKEAGKAERAKKKEEELRKKVKKGLLASVAETITGESKIKEEEIGELLDELELGMLESDVALSVAEEIKEELRKRIIGSKVKRGQTAIFVKDSLSEILLKMFEETPGFDMAEKISGKEKPCRVMVVGPNGAGKTTTIAKIVMLLQNNGQSVCVAASDTFRAAAVEQLVYHGNKLGVKVVHGAYGSDPTSIAFDAVNYAKANNLDVVLIDTAGRQETNTNLLNQLKKMDRIIKPDFKIYVGESIAGNAVVEQISRFNGDIGLDGVILTKLDCDAKGGTVISVSRVAKLPILYVGIGQGYGDLKPFVAKEIVEEILS